MERVRRLRMVSQAIPGGLGSPSIPTTGDRLQWQDAAGRTRMKVRGMLVRPNSHGPGDENRRGGAPGGAASRTWDANAVQMGFASFVCVA